MIWICVIVIALFVAHLISDSINKKEARNDIEKRLGSIQDFKATNKIRGVEGLYVFAFDDEREKILHVTKGKTEIINYNDIISVELIEDNSTIVSRSLGRAIGGVMVGGLIAGDAAAIVGGLSGNQNIKKKVSSVIVKIVKRDVCAPTIIIECFNSITMCAGEESISIDSPAGSVYYKPGLADAKRITDIIKVIIDRMEKRGSVSSRPTIESFSVADELTKLSSLRDKGILSEEEFQEQKNKILNN